VVSETEGSMRERLFRVIHTLEEQGWKDNPNHKLIGQLRHIAETFEGDCIAEILEAFHHA
jgi:hypothetical protein